MKLYYVLMNLSKKVKATVAKLNVDYPKCNKMVNGPRNDYITEFGTSNTNGNSWTYIKWANGNSECWQSISKSVTSSSAWGNFYEGSPSSYYTYPSGLFISPPSFQLGTEGRNNIASCGVNDYSYNSGTKDRTPSIYVVRPNSTTGTHYITMYARGRWKS